MDIEKIEFGETRQFDDIFFRVQTRAVGEEEILQRIDTLTEKVDRLLALCDQTYLVSDKFAQESDAPDKDGPAET